MLNKSITIQHKVSGIYELHFVPFFSFTDSTTIEKLRAVCSKHSNLRENQLGQSLDSLFFGSSASQVLYLTEVCFSLRKNIL